MKAYFKLIIILSTLLLLQNDLKAFNAPSDSFILEGTVVDGNLNIPGALINTYLNSDKISSTTTNRQGGFHLYFMHNKLYTIEIVKKDYIILKISLDTKIPDEVMKKGGIGETTDFPIEIYENFPGLKTDIFNNPVQYFIFNSKKGWYFDEDTKKSKTPQLNSFKKKIAALKTKAANDELKKANDFYKKQKYEEAILSYYRVLELSPLSPNETNSERKMLSYDRILEYSPDNKQASDRIKEIKKILKKDKNFERNYNDIIKKGDDLILVKSFSEAKDCFKKAKVLKPDDLYPGNRLYYIDSLITRLYDTNKKDYDKYIVTGDKKFIVKEYDSAQIDYEKASQLIPDEQYPKKQLANIQASKAAEQKQKMDAAKAEETKFNNFVKKADVQLEKSDFPGAINTYKQALNIRPEDTYCLSQKGKAEKMFTASINEKFKKAREKNYTDTVIIADKAFYSKDYQKAMDLYSEALSIKPNEEYPAKRIKEISLLINPKLDLTTRQVTENTSEKEDQNKDGSQKKLIEKLSADKINKLLYSAVEQEKKGNIEEACKIYFDIAGIFHNNEQLGKALEYLNKALDLYKSKNDKAGQTKVLNEMATVFYETGQYKETILTYKEIIELKKELGDIKGEGDILTELGTILENTYQYDNASEAFTLALNIRQQLKDKEGISEICKRLGGIYYNQNDYKKSVDYYKQALDIASASNNRDLKGGLLNSLGVTFYRMGKYDDALKFYSQSIIVDNEIGNKMNLSLTYNNIGNVNFDWNKFEKAIDYYEKSLKLKREINFEEGIAVSLFNIGNTYLELKNLSKALEFLNSGLSLAKKLKFREVIQQSYKALSRLYEVTHDFREAMNSYKAFVSVMGPGMIIEGQISEMNEMYERESKMIKSLRHELQKQKLLYDFEAMQRFQKQKELQFKDLELKQQQAKIIKQRILLMFTLICLGFAGIMALQFFRRFREKKHYSELIGFQKQQISESIAYASRIQKAVMPPGDLLSSFFPESFLFNKPKDYVSGDYFYITVKKDKIYFAVADCTGHGVPGAFMSMLGISLIKDVIDRDQELTTSEILNKLRDELINSLHQTGREDEAKDGIDIALCVIDRNTMQLEYSGANNPCYIIRNREIIELKADRMPIGIHPDIKPFTSHQVTLESNDFIYLFSDGFRDQIGEETDKKFKIGQFNNLLISIHSIPPSLQASILEERLNSWKGKMDQTDDILIMGIKV